MTSTICLIGSLLYYKRLEKGTFELPRYNTSVGSITLSYAQMGMIIDGLSIRNLQKRVRYKLLLSPETTYFVRVFNKPLSLEECPFFSDKPVFFKSGFFIPV